MSTHRRHRRPAAFRLDDDRVTVRPVREVERDIGSAVQIVPEPELGPPCSGPGFA